MSDDGTVSVDTSVNDAAGGDDSVEPASTTDSSTAAPTPAALTRIEKLTAALHSLIDEIGEADLSECSDAAIVEVAAATEQAINRLTFQGDRQIVECSDRSMPLSLGYKTVVQFMNHRLRITDPARRKKQLQPTAVFTQVTGEKREPEYPTLSKAFESGQVGPGHNRVVIDVLSKIPAAVAHDEKVAAEAMLAGMACEHTPQQLDVLGARLLAHLDPDGDLTNDTDRQRRRQLYLGRQGADKMSKLTAILTPAARARLEQFLEVWAQPGMNNPEDPDAPTGTYSDAPADQVAAAAERDGRSLAQRNHDALDALMTSVLEKGVLGESHRGLPTHLVIKADLADLHAEAGIGVTAGGTILPIHEVISQAAQSQPWLAIFDNHTQIPLYLGRGKRLASQGQRIASFARPDGHLCSAPGCDQAATRVEMHHAVQDWAQGGKTNIDELTPACPTHNRQVGENPGQFTTGIYETGPDKGRCWWQLNAAPGAPPNPKRTNALPEVKQAYGQHLDAAKENIHGTDEPGTHEPGTHEPGTDAPSTGQPDAGQRLNVSDGLNVSDVRDRPDDPAEAGVVDPDSATVDDP